MNLTIDLHNGDELKEYIRIGGDLCNVRWHWNYKDVRYDMRKAIGGVNTIDWVVFAMKQGNILVVDCSAHTWMLYQNARSKNI